MIGANKILTVSYGTFSCTLEGFDDPFTTMKAIAEYFRDLAAQDRFFGAEPPTPDAAMLHRIAEKEVQRRVEAKINENGVILRAGHAAPEPALPEPEAPARPAAETPPTVESVAAKLTRIRSAVAQGQMPEAEAVPVFSDPAEDAATEALHVPDDDLAPLQTEPEADFGSEADLLALTAAVAAHPMADDFDEDYAETEFDASDADANPVAFAEMPELDAALLTAAPDALPEDEAELLDEPPEEYLPEYAAAQEDVPAAAIAEDETPLVDLVAGIVADVDESSRALSDRIHRARARVIRIRQPEDAEPAQSESPDAPTMPPAAAEHAPRSVIRPTRPARTFLHPAAAPAEDIAPVQAAEDDPMTHPQFPEPAEAGEAAVSRLLAETNSQMAGVENRRRLSAIQHLKAAVAATVAERRAGAAKPVNEEDRLDPYRSVLSRMMRPGKETEEGQAEPQARLLEPPVAAPATPSPLVLVLEQRVDDLPRPPAPAPVLLTNLVTREEDEILAEDEDQAGIETDAALFTDTRGFAEFAGRLGAESLPAMLEAAAAYAACIEGRPHFSRPQIMRQVTAMAGDSSSREDALRSFGALLRTGRIVKVKRGQYALSDSNNVLAEARKLVG